MSIPWTRLTLGIPRATSSEGVPIGSSIEFQRLDKFPYRISNLAWARVETDFLRRDIFLKCQRMARARLEQYGPWIVVERQESEWHWQADDVMRQQQCFLIYVVTFYRMELDKLDAKKGP